MCDNPDPRESMHSSNVYSQCNSSYQKYHSAVTDIPVCSAVDYCQAAAFRLQLPSFNSYNDHNEYLAFIIPRKNPEKRSFPTKSVPCKPCPEDRSDIGDMRRVPKYSPRCRWNTEYRSTIDDCAKKRMTVQPKCDKSPTCLRKSYCNRTSPQPPAHTYSSRSSTKQFVKTRYFPTQRHFRTAISCPSYKLPTCEQKRICKNMIRSDETSSQKTNPKSILYEDNCYNRNVTPQTHNTCSKRPLNKCIPMDGGLTNEGSFQKSTRRPMSRCHF